MRANLGDEIVVDSLRTGGPRREGEIREVLGKPGEEHYRVLWDDGHESIFFPGTTTHTVQLGGRHR